jgi:hypothetical protein
MTTEIVGSVAKALADVQAVFSLLSAVSDPKATKRRGNGKRRARNRLQLFLHPPHRPARYAGYAD